MPRHRPEESFAAFWEAYPRHVAKKDARRAWTTLDPDAHLVAAILEALAWQQQEWTDMQFCPYPATYLRSERWTDEKPKPKSIVDHLPAWQRRNLFFDRKTT